MAARQHAVWTNSSVVSSYKKSKVVTMAMPVADSSSLKSSSQFSMPVAGSSSLKSSSQFSMASSFRARTQQSVVTRWRIGKRIFLKCSLESSVDVIGTDNVDLLNRMRELVDLTGGKAEGVDDASLMRFLKEFSLNVDEAAKRFVKHQEWEASIKPNGFISEKEIPNELNSKKSYMQGKDKQGRPLCVILARNHVYNKDVDEFRRFIVYTIDKVLSAASTDGKLNAIIDLKGMGFKNLDSKGFITGFDVYQSHYPERIERLYMVNAPLIFNGVWKVASPFLNETTRKKIEFVENKKVQEILLSVFDSDQLPVAYGGTAELVLLQDAVVDGWPPSASVP